MDAVDIRKRLSDEAFVCLHILETCFNISTFDIENPEVCYHIFETIPKHRSYGVVRKFSSLGEATKHYESLLKDNPDPKYVIKPDGPLYRKNVEGDVYMVRYSRVFETLKHWKTNFQNKKRSDEDLYRICSKVGSASESRYERTDSIGNIFNDTVITDDEQVFLWNSDPASKVFKKEIRHLRYFVKEMKPLATNGDRFDEFEDFLTNHVMRNPAPRKELIMWLFHYPVFMTGQGAVRYLEALNKITSDTRTGVGQHAAFKDALQTFDNNWKNTVTASSDQALKDVLNSRGTKYSDDGYDLPRFAHNCCKHYTQNAIRYNAKELDQPEVVAMLNTKPYFQNFLEKSFQGLYPTMEILDKSTSSPSNMSKDMLLMLKGGKGL